MGKKNGFHTVEPLNNDLTRIALVWNNTVEKKYGNETVSKEIIDVKEFPSFLNGLVTRQDIEEVAKELMASNNIVECAIVYE